MAPARRMETLTAFMLALARSFQSLGDRPLVVVAATEEALAEWLPLQDSMAP
jgi:hypothetical protein